MAGELNREAVRERANAAEQATPRSGAAASRRRCCGPAGGIGERRRLRLRRSAPAPLRRSSRPPRPFPMAVEASLGCGNPTAVAELHEGETVLDLGSGGGIDVLLSARRVSARPARPSAST